MFCKDYTRAGIHNGKPVVIAELVTKTTPATLPTKTDGVENIEAGMLFGPGSSLLSTNPFELHVMNDEYTWNKIEKLLE